MHGLLPKERLYDILESFEEQARPSKQAAVCRPGCAYCCTHFGTLDVTTLEGLIIKEHLTGLPPEQHQALLKRIRTNSRKKKQGRTARCPFLSADKRCLIYEVRPFSCRQLYSLKVCGEHGPVVHTHYPGLVQSTVLALQRLDSTGYSGHLTHILMLLERSDFLKTYLSGGLDPGRIEAFGRSHGLVINRAITGRGSVKK